METPHIVGIVNITEDSFSDGGKFLSTSAAIAHSSKLLGDGAEIIDLGPSTSNPDVKRVSAEEEIRRLDHRISHRRRRSDLGRYLPPETQRYAMAGGVTFLNDIQGFPDPFLYPDLAHRAPCKLIVMHAVQERGAAQRLAVLPLRFGIASCDSSTNDLESL